MKLWKDTREMLFARISLSELGSQTAGPAFRAVGGTPRVQGWVSIVEKAHRLCRTNKQKGGGRII